MKIIHIVNEKRVKKTKKEIERECRQYDDDAFHFINEYKTVPIKEPIYVVEMTAKEFQLVSFYLELEGRKPITNIELGTKIQKESKDE